MALGICSVFGYFDPLGLGLRLSRPSSAGFVMLHLHYH